MSILQKAANQGPCPASYMKWANIKKTLGGHYTLESLHSRLRIAQQGRRNGRQEEKEGKEGLNP